MTIEGADRLAEGCPNAVIVDASGHHEDQNLILANGWGLHDLELHGLVRAAMAFLTDRPGMHAGGDMIGRRNLADLIEVLQGWGSHSGAGHGAVPVLAWRRLGR